MKFLVCALFLALAVCQIAAQSHNVEWGARRPGDRQLQREIVSKESSFLQIVTKDVTMNTDSIISYINVVDQYTNDNGGTAMMLNGGPGSSYVTIHFKSKRGHGFNFIVEVYGQ